MSQSTLPIELPKQLIRLPADQLLDQFGAGGHSPGSGSAAALMGLLSAQLIATVCKISKAGDGQSVQEFEFVLGRIETRVIPELKALFQRDAEDFDRVIRARVQRDNETDPAAKRRYREQALRLLEESTDIIFTISRQCLSLVDYALIVFDGGSKKVRGDSGAAISAAIAGAMSGLFIINLNLRSFQSGRWAIGRKREAENLHAEIIRKQEDAFTRIVTLQPEEVSEIQPSLFD
ncbi:cyclodeaminase/cyclohydrolase family protein [Sphingomonas cavernae]|uniref:Cyclodeaminase/cyclohydrolase domain-containing protein n=1 Tax=Sphingomonas cavernae TaxID=2320861 RepID=A0A418WRV1_9SPHN|nr:cyclodeaminase/cyclohydrolase family protein [Sphingomonas cavernae]RJF93947.1 hypothetical protein D3876_06665 [Sphingomonas cavernae]